jgi:hypothetical protein
MNHAVRPELLAVAEQDESFLAPQAKPVWDPASTPKLLPGQCRRRTLTAALQGTGWAWAR